MLAGRPSSGGLGGKSIIKFTAPLKFKLTPCGPTGPIEPVYPVGPLSSLADPVYPAPALPV